MSRKQKKSDYLSIFGIMFEFIKKIMDALNALGGTDEDLRRVLTEPNLAKQIAELIMTSKQKVGETFNVIMDYGLSLTEMIKAGKYDWFDDDITDKRFELQGDGQHEVELVLVHLNRNATNKEVLEHLNNQGLEPAKIEHLLAFGATFPELQKQFPIVVLGSSFANVHGVRYYPVLDCNDGKRMLILYWRDDDNPWHDYWRFLALRK